MTRASETFVFWLAVLGGPVVVVGAALTFVAWRRRKRERKTDDAIAQRYRWEVH